MIQPQLPHHEIVLLGAGHTHLHVLRMWQMRPIPQARLTCVSNSLTTAYSGMLPGVLAGDYPAELMHIDLLRRCAAIGARFLQAEASGLDLSSRSLLFHDRPPLRFDLLSIAVGSLPAQGVDVEGVLPVKPIATFLERLHQAVRPFQDGINEGRLRLVVVGGGAGGVELAFCAPVYLSTLLPNRFIETHIVDHHQNVVPGASASAADKVRAELQRRGVQLHPGDRVVRVQDGHLRFASGNELDADIVIWATSAAGQPLLQRFGLATDERGFLLTNGALQSVDDPDVFVVGDAGTCTQFRIPKAGVYAVRQGPFLWDNLQRRLHRRPLRRWTPQRRFLSLLHTGSRRAILDYRGVGIHARWCWNLKDRIDLRFIRKHQDYRQRRMAPVARLEDTTTAMRCLGCGGKVPSQVLQDVLGRLRQPPYSHVLWGMDQAEDVAALKLRSGRTVVATTDFFTAPLEDPYVAARIAALNALSDVWTKGARATAALAICGVPPGGRRQQRDLLETMLRGSLHEFLPRNIPIVGGHTIESEQPIIGFTILAEPEDGIESLRVKSALRPGDHLVLTKPLGTGVLLAAIAQARCRAEWYPPLLKTMLCGNDGAAKVAQEHRLASVTDVTGFGLAGHLLEMLHASHLGAELHLDQVPVLPGAAQLLREGLESTLAPANHLAEEEMALHWGHGTDAYALLFDPQTSGGLLMGVPEAVLLPVLEGLRGRGAMESAVIGRVTGQTSPRLHICHSPVQLGIRS